MSADVIKAASLPLQLDQWVSEKSPISCHKIRKKPKHKRRADSYEVSDSRVDTSSINNQRNTNKSCKWKLKGRAEVNQTGSTGFCNTVDTVSDKCLKVRHSGSKNKCHKQKHKRTSESFVLCDSDSVDQVRLVKRKKI